MKKIIVRALLLFGLGILAVSFAATAIIADNMNKTAAKNSAATLLSAYEERMLSENYTTKDQYIKMAERESTDFRITVIAAGEDKLGKVFADTFKDPAEMKNHADGTRQEITDALSGKTGTVIRPSEEIKGMRFLYTAKLVTIEGAEAVILRIAVPVSSINSYLYGALLTTTLIFLLILIITAFVARFVAGRLNKTFVLIKEKLGGVLKPEAETRPIVLTRHDDINAVLQDIDEISDKLHTTLAGYKAEKRKLDLILENIDQVIIALDAQKQIISCNKTAEDYFNFEFSATPAIETAIRNKAILDNISQVMVRNEFISYDHMRLNGQVFEVRFFPVNLNEISLIITAQNVTDIRKTSLEKQEFFANAGHELNTPLSSIIGYSEMLIADKKPNIAFAETINKEALRMKLLIEDMLKISELEENREIYDAQFDLKSVVEQVITAALPKAENKKITLTADLESCVIFANAEKITEVAANLVDNAIKYTDENGAVAVRLKTENGKAILSVKDNGIGIPQKALSRVFERFYRVDKRRSTAEGGTGLGLAIVKHICNHYSAPIKIQSTEGLGTEITVMFACISV
ncbi:MAG: ATP-binding protein [Firmicutes bacterium]|nr:ATP-binding protein [Bacillota bacterium]